MAGLEDVARDAGVSITTASRALAGRGRISAATRARVQEAADRLGYVPSAAASALASGRAQNVGVIVSLMDRWFFATVLDGIADRLAPLGYDLTLYNVTADPAQRRRLFEVSLRRGRVDALIILSVAVTDEETRALSALGIPVLGLGVPHRAITGPRVDDVAVGRAATEHLLALGHRNIVHVGHAEPPASGDPDLDVPTQRRHGFEAAMAAAGIAEARSAPAEFTVAGGRRAAAELLSGSRPPTAVFAASGEIAYGVIAAARARGMDVPGELSVIGVDGHDLAELFALTTIDQFPHAQGERVAEATLGMLGAAPPPPEGPLPFDLVVRASTAPPR